MAVELKTGTYGSYYGNDYNSSNALTTEQMQVNAKYIYSYLIAEGWSANAICGMLGNMQSESSINPGRWQSNDVGNTSGGYGLVQWTPATKYITWCNENSILPQDMDSNIKRILYEVENKLQWIATGAYKYSFKEFTTSTDTPYNLAMAFLNNYERPAQSLQPGRGYQAQSWYEYLVGTTPTPTPTPTTKSKSKFKWVLYARNLRNKY